MKKLTKTLMKHTHEGCSEGNTYMLFISMETTRATGNTKNTIIKSFQLQNTDFQHSKHHLLCIFKA